MSDPTTMDYIMELSMRRTQAEHERDAARAAIERVRTVCDERAWSNFSEPNWPQIEVSYILEALEVTDCD